MTFSDEHDRSQMNHLVQLGDEFESLWEAGHQPKIEELVQDITEPSQRLHAIRELVLREIELRRQFGEKVLPEDYKRRFPEYGQELAVWFARRATQKRNQAVRVTPRTAQRSIRK